MTVLNLFDRDTATRSTTPGWSATCRSTLDRVLRRRFDYEALLAANPTSLDPKFRQADQFQAPREIRFLVKFEF